MSAKKKTSFEMAAMHHKKGELSLAMYYYLLAGRLRKNVNHPLALDARSIIHILDIIERTHSIHFCLYLYDLIIAENIDNFDMCVRLIKILIPHGYFDKVAVLFERIDKYPEAKKLTHIQRLRKYVRFMLSDQRIVKFKYKDQIFNFFISGENVGLDVFLTSGEFFEEEELAYSLSLLPKNPVIIDIGANAGTHSVYWAKMAGAVKIFPFEPNPMMLPALMVNAKLNGADSIIFDHLGYAVGAKKGLVTLQNHDEYLGAVVSQFKSDPKGKTPCVALDSIFKDKVDFIKIDVEGAEEDVIKGAKKLLTAHKPILMIEINNKRQEHMLPILASFGYKVLKEFKGHGYSNFFLKA